MVLEDLRKNLAVLQSRALHGGAATGDDPRPAGLGSQLKILKALLASEVCLVDARREIEVASLTGNRSTGGVPT